MIGDELRIEQILINIVNNAIKYTPEDKDVELKAEELGKTEDGKIRYHFTVRDMGIGISEDYLPHIFDSFTREQNTTITFIRSLNRAHDRYIVLDESTKDMKIYHCGASSKDAGNKITTITRIGDINEYKPVIKAMLGNPILVLR